MDACEHEYESMSRHGRKVPVGFYHQFIRDACALSNKYARGRIISVLEGGYSDRALISGTIAQVSGLITAHNDPADDKVDEGWWNVDNLVKVSPVERSFQRNRFDNGCRIDSWKRQPGLARDQGAGNPCKIMKTKNYGWSAL